MNIKYVNEVKQHLGSISLEILTDIFCKSSGFPPWIQSDRYRAEHPQWLDALDELEQPTIFLERDHERKKYLISVYALPLLEDDGAQSLLAVMEEIFSFFLQEYPKRLSEPLTLDEIVEAVNHDSNLVIEALCYMVKANGLCAGLSNGFPVAAGSTISISESVLRNENFGAILSKFYEWHFINPPKSPESHKLLCRKEHQISEGFFSTDDSSEKPKWLDELDDHKKHLIGEIDTALKSGLMALPTMGLRTLIDLVIVEHVGDKGTFKDKLAAFEKEGLVSPQQREQIETVLEAGNAASHRAYFPNKNDLQTCVDVIKHMMHGVYALHHRTKQLSNNTPKRPNASTKKIDKGKDHELRNFKT